MITQGVKNLLAMQEIQETCVRSLGQKDPLEEENSNLLQYCCLKNPTDRKDWQVQSKGSQRIRRN